MEASIGFWKSWKSSRGRTYFLRRVEVYKSCFKEAMEELVEAFFSMEVVVEVVVEASHDSPTNFH